jgi:hypothetical protein
MSIFSWFFKKPPVEAAPDESDRTAATTQVDTEPALSQSMSRKNERLERREQLYTVVRESMTGAGILSSSYKFKVLSLDSRGLQYLIMMDIARRYAGDIGRLTEIEGLIAHNTKARYEITVSAVYWRISGQVTGHVTRVSGPMPLSAQHSMPAELSSHVSDETLHPEEIAAFKKALAGVAPAAATVTSQRFADTVPNFADTEINENHSPLSGTQYGDLR